MQVIGKMPQLLSSHGDVNVDKAVAAIAVLTELSAIDISEINKASEAGGIYISRDGTIFDTFDAYAEGQATFKMVPTGLKTKFNNTPLVASFVKSKGTWIGALIDIPEKIFREYKKAYGHGGFQEQYTEIFCGDNHGRDITGYGLNGMLNIIVDEPEVETEPSLETDIENLKNALDKAEKCLLDKTMNKSKRKKAEDKVTNLKKQIAALESKLKAQETETNCAETEIDITVEGSDEPVSAEISNVIEIKTESTQDTDSAEQTENSGETNDDYAVSEEQVVTEEEPNSTEFSTINEPVVENEQTSDEPTDGIVEEDTKNAIQRIKETKKQPRAKKTVQKSNTAVSEEKTTEISEDASEDVPKLVPVIDKAVEKEMWSEIGEDVSDEEVKLMSEFATELYNSLIDKENWKEDNGRGLLEYIKGLVICIENYRKLKKKDTNGYVMSDNGKKMLFNTGLIDKYGNFIYIIDHTAQKSFGCFQNKVLTVVKSKSSLLDEGFALENIRVLPKKFKFVNNIKDLVFDSTIDDFDLIDTEHLNHIVNERRSRFPAKYATESCKNLTDRIKISIEQALAIQEVDYKYIVPMYNLTTQEVEFLIPLHLDTVYGQKPELCIIIAKKNNLWKIFTIISSDLAYSNARLVAKVPKIWNV